jgi:Icc-related predicted phosphoesterase
MPSAPASTSAATPCACQRNKYGNYSGAWVGDKTLNAVLPVKRPKLVLCGHIHEARGEDTIGASRVVNPGPAFAGHYAVVEVGEDVTVRLD